MLNKTKTIIAAASVLITGIGAGTGAYIATRNNDTAASVSSGVSSMASNKTESVDTSPIDNAVSAGVEKINEAASKAIKQIESKASSAAAQNAQSKSAEANVDSGLPESYKITVDKDFDATVGTIHISTIDILYPEKAISFSYSLPLKSEYQKGGITKASVDGQTFLIDAAGTRFVCGGYSTSQMWFQFTDISLLSPIKIETSFGGILNTPIVVTLNIPVA